MASQATGQSINPLALSPIREKVLTWFVFALSGEEVKYLVLTTVCLSITTTLSLQSVLKPLKGDTAVEETSQHETTLRVFLDAISSADGYVLVDGLDTIVGIQWRTSPSPLKVEVQQYTDSFERSICRS